MQNMLEMLIILSICHQTVKSTNVRLQSEAAQVEVHWKQAARVTP